MSTIDTSTWNPDPSLNESIGDIPLNESASIKQTWQAIQMLMVPLTAENANASIIKATPVSTDIFHCSIISPF